MEKIPFQVSAKTARLIGRENISDLCGAVNELVKNGYDADAECVIVKFDIPYVEILRELSYKQVEEIFSKNKELFAKTYELKDEKFVLRAELPTSLIDELKSYYASFGKIIIIDNGIGMTKNILKTSWMNIGTNDKEINYLSANKKRIKTGAKGIGRFALDKLSLHSKVFTKNKTDNLYCWELDWSQFDTNHLLKDVNATITEDDCSFLSKVEEILSEDFELVKNYDWSSGTIIILEPLREPWTKKLFMKTNETFNNINPFNSVDQFDVIVLNKYYTEYNFNTSKQEIKDFDYCIEAQYDGNDDVYIILHRNEIDIRKKSVKIEYFKSHAEVYGLDEFWQRDAFKKKGFEKESFIGVYERHYKLSELQIEDASACRTIGPFKLKFYYLKNGSSSVEITKDYIIKKRKKFLEKFSGIYLYRDDYKVRPYGEEGQFYDWLDLSGRVQRSPAAASHKSGLWRVSPNQIIGSVSISRIDNPLLVDSANREGLMLNSTYNAFVNIIQCVLSKFEYDRQFPLREYANWLKAKKSKHFVEIEEMYQQSKKNVTKSNNNTELDNEDINNKDAENSSESDNQEKDYSKSDYEKAIVYLAEKNKEEINVQQLLMVLSGSGVLAQTFAHEISRVGTDLGSRGQHLRVIIDRLLDYKEYTGDEDYNPYNLLDELDATDLLLSDWVNLMMDSLEVDKYTSGNINLIDFLNKTVIKWQSLLSKKHITVNFHYEEDLQINLIMPEVDLHLLVNNFLINSAYYLEHKNGVENKIINIDLFIEDMYYCLDLYNNGPKLADEYTDNPNIIFSPQVSSKENGTGIGLWIAHEAVVRNDGILTFVDTEKGFKIRAKWIKEKKNV